MKVVIPTAGLGSRLGKLTKHLNKSLLRVGEKAVISHIIELYPVDTTFVIILGYRGDLVRKYLEIAHPQSKFQFVTVEKYEGEGSGLTTSLSAAEKHLQCPFIFHACDTLLGLPYGPRLNSNWLLVSRKDSDQYRVVTTKGIDVDKSVVCISSKGNVETADEYHYTGIAGIQDYTSFWHYLNNLERGDSDADVFREWIEFSNEIVDIRIRTYNSQYWYDCGNLADLFRARDDYDMSYHVLEKDNEDIYMVNGKVIKFFADSKRCRDRIIRAKEHLPDAVPELSDTGKHFFAYDKIHGEVFSETITPKKTKEYLNWCQANLWTSNKFDVHFHPDCYEFYINKTISRIEMYVDLGKEDTDCVINGIYVPSAMSLIDTLARYDIMFYGIKSRFHGDMVLDNIIDTGYDYMLIDWRESFALGKQALGDLYYDLSKFAHSLVMKHDVLVNGLFKFTEIGRSDDNRRSVYSMDLMRSENLIQCQDSFIAWCHENHFAVSKIKALMGIIWINMAPLHPERMGEFLFNYGKLYLYRALQEIKNEQNTFNSTKVRESKL